MTSPKGKHKTSREPQEILNMFMAAHDIRAAIKQPPRSYDPNNCCHYNQNRKRYQKPEDSKVICVKITLLCLENLLWNI